MGMDDFVRSQQGRMCNGCLGYDNAVKWLPSPFMAFCLFDHGRKGVIALFQPNRAVQIFED